MPLTEPDWSSLSELRLTDYAPRRAVRLPATAVPRSATPCVDVHNHLGRWLAKEGWVVPDVAAQLELMDGCGVATVVNLDGRWGSELHDNLERYDQAHPGRFVTFAHVDWSLLADPGGAAGAEAAVRQLEASAAAGARGLKVWKDLGLRVRDDAGALVLPDDERVGAVLTRAGELGLPVLIHTADPVAFFGPLDRRNERLEELVREPSWWFGDPARFPSLERLLDALEGAIEAAPGTTFIGAHVGCCAEDLAWVGRLLASYPNAHVDTGGRIGELGRQPRAFARLVADHPDRVLFGTDAYPADEVAYATWFRFLETDDECFSYEPGAEIPPQGRWDISGVALPDELLSGVYAGNARRVLRL